jgi:hypothetical protein
MRTLLLPLACIAALCHSGCVTPLDVKSSAFPVPPAKVPIAISAGVVDNRPYVVSGRKSDRYEGIMHGIYGIPANLNNIEKKPFSSYLGDRIVAGFEKAGYKVNALTLPKGINEEDVMRRAAATNPERAFILRLNDWRIDWGGFIVPSWQFFYDVEIQVIDKSRGVLTRRNFTGLDTPPVKGSDSIFNNSLIHYQRKFEEFMSEPSIVAALVGLPDTASEEKRFIKDRLEELKNLFEAELISSEEYTSKRQLILSELAPGIQQPPDYTQSASAQVTAAPLNAIATQTPTPQALPVVQTADTTAIISKPLATTTDVIPITDNPSKHVAVATQKLEAVETTPPLLLGLRVYILDNEVCVQSVAPSSAAMAAGLREGDRIVSLNKKKIRGDQFPLLRELNAIGSKSKGAMEITWHGAGDSREQTRSVVWGKE